MNEKNNTVEVVQAGKLRSLKAAAFVVLLFLAVYVPALVVKELWNPAAPVAVPAVIGITFAMSVVLMLILTRSWRGLKAYGFAFCVWRYLAAAVYLGIPVAIGLTYIAQLLPAFNPESGARFAPWMPIVYFFILAPISEETIFRGLLQTTLARIFPAEWGSGFWRISAAAVGIAVLFGLIHLRVSVLTAIAAFFLSLLAGELRHRSGSLLPAIVVHVIFNAAGMLWTIK